MKKLLLILTTVAIIACCSVVALAEDADQEVTLISEAPAAETEGVAEEVKEEATEETVQEATEETAVEEEKEETKETVTTEDVVKEEAATEEVKEEVSVEETTVEFTDVAVDDADYVAIAALAEKGIIVADANNAVLPDDEITREDVVKLVVDARGFDANAEAVIEAPDAYAVSKEVYAYVATAVEKGIIKGYEDGSIKPASVVTRAEFATIIVRALSATSEVQGESFTDVSADAWYAADVECAKNLGIVGGYEDGTFRGDNTVTRREAFAMVYRMVNLLDALQQG